jgi:hypothetical protein
MLSHALWKPKVYLFAAGLFLLTTVVMLTQQTGTLAQSANIEDTQTTMQQLFLQLDQKQLDDHDFTFSVRFVAPLGSEEIFLIGDPSDRRYRLIEEVGADYVCFRQRDDSYNAIRCTPFSNIREVNYLEF